MLKIENIDVYYGAIHAVKNVSFEVGEGEIVALIGANGAGKSTILKTVSGLMHPRTGTITFCDQNITHMDAYKLLRTGLAHVPEGRRIFLEMTVQENLEMGAYIRKTVDEADLEKVFTYFPRLKERRKQIAGTLSGGEQQMLAMSRALMSHPKLMILSETQMILGPKPSLRQFAMKMLCQRSGMMMVTSRSSSMRISCFEPPRIFFLFMTTTSGSLGRTMDS